MTEEGDFVRIPVNEEFLKLFFVKGLCIKVLEGITDDYKFVSLIQDSCDGLFYFLFKRGNVIPGMHARIFTVAYKVLE